MILPSNGQSVSLSSVRFANDVPQLVNDASAMRFSAVFAAVRILSTGISSLTPEVYTSSTGSRDLDTKHWANKLLSRPNKAMTFKRWIEASISQMCLWGNSYSIVTRNKRTKEVIDLFLLDPSRMTVRATNAGIEYLYTDGLGTTVYQPDQICHFSYLTTDGIMGVSPISALRQSVQLGMSANAYAENLFKNGGKFSGVLTYKGASAMTEALYGNIKTSWKQQVEENPGGTAILGADMAYSSLAMSLVDAAFIETYQLSIQTIAMAFGIPKFALQSETNAVYSGMAEASRVYRESTLRPLIDSIEDTLNSVFFAYDEPHYVKFYVDELMKTDPVSQYQAYEIALRNKFLSVNEVRDLIDYNRWPDPLAEQPDMTQTTISPSSKIGS